MTSLTPRRWLKIPIEVAARELDAKLLLAATFAEDNWGVIIGRQDLVRNQGAGLVKGIQYDKSISKGMASAVEGALQNDDIFVASCEEGLIFIDEATYVRRKISADNLSRSKAFFAWGENQIDAIENQLGGKVGNIIATGSPRVDLLRPEFRHFFEDQATAIRDRHGPFVLINTKFGRYNPYVGREKFYHYAKNNWGIINNDEEDAFFCAHVDYQGRIFTAFLDLIEALAERNDGRRTVIRPHTAEDWSTYRERFAGRANVTINSDGSANEWILAADTMIHNNCTTAVESYLLSRPCISFEPVHDERFATELPRMCSLVCERVPDVIDELDRLRGGTSDSGKAVFDQDNEAAIARYIRNVSGAFAVDRIKTWADAERLDACGLTAPGDAEVALISDARATGPASGKGAGPQKKNYRAQKFPPMSVGDVAAILKRLARVRKGFENLAVMQLEPDLFCVYRPR